MLHGNTVTRETDTSVYRRMGAPLLVLAVSCAALAMMNPVVSEPMPVTNLAAVGANAPAKAGNLLSDEAVAELDTTNRVFTNTADVSTVGFVDALKCLNELGGVHTPTSCGTNEHQNTLIFVSCAFILFAMYFFAPFYLFPEACVCGFFYKFFPFVLEPVLPGLKLAPEHAVQSIQFSFKVVAVIAIIGRLFAYLSTFEPYKPPSMGLAFWSIVVAFLLFLAMSNLDNVLVQAR